LGRGIFCPGGAIATLLTVMKGNESAVKLVGTFRASQMPSACPVDNYCLGRQPEGLPRRHISNWPTERGLLSKYRFPGMELTPSAQTGGASSQDRRHHSRSSWHRPTVGLAVRGSDPSGAACMTPGWKTQALGAVEKSIAPALTGMGRSGCSSSCLEAVPLAMRVGGEYRGADLRLTGDVPQPGSLGRYRGIGEWRKGLGGGRGGSRLARGLYSCASLAVQRCHQTIPGGSLARLSVFLHGSYVKGSTPYRSQPKLGKPWGDEGTN